MEITPIGILRTCFGEKFSVPRQPGLCPSAWGELEFIDPFRSPDMLRGLEDFSHLWLIFGFHQTSEQGWSPTVRPPRLGGNQRVGVFASRSTFRPNGLGLSLVKLEEVVWKSDKGKSIPRLKVSGVDLVDGTPIYDIKPYLAYAESIPEAKSAYAEEPLKSLPVIVDEAIQAEFESLPLRSQAVIREALAMDPRPATSRKEDGRIYGAWLCGWNVQFSIEAGACHVRGLQGKRDLPSGS